jgi:hypothetical protein
VRLQRTSDPRLEELEAGDPVRGRLMPIRVALVLAAVVLILAV